MPRRSRIDAPGALHHIIVRGIERRAIFKDDLDREKFLEKLGSVLAESRTPCFAYALMRNHVHLLLRTGTVPIATVMRRLLTGHAMYFNRRYRRHGHLFQNRYKSAPGDWTSRRFQKGSLPSAKSARNYCQLRPRIATCRGRGPSCAIWRSGG
jgi:REP element-mobilizing transposase RayT